MAAGVAWGSTQSLGKIAASSDHGHLGLIVWQLCIATGLTGAIALGRGRPLHLTRRALVFAPVVAVMGILLPNATFYLAVERLPAGIMSIVISAVPILALPIAVALGRDRATIPRLLGLAAGLAGVALLAVGDAGPGAAARPVAWLLVALLGPLLYAAESNFVATWGMGGLDPVQAIFLASATALLVALPLALATGQWIDPTAPWGPPEWAVTAASAVSALTYVAYVWLAAQTGAVFASQLSYVVTASGLLWASAILGERASPWTLLSLALLLGGVALVSPRPHRTVPA